MTIEQRFFNETEEVRRILMFDYEFNEKMDNIFSENEDFTLDLLKKDYYYGLFNSGFDFYLPDEFINKFKNGYQGNNKSLLYKLYYLDLNLSRLDTDGIEKIIAECLEEDM
jgi:hypothetical protein